ncbi:hypothetical protein DUZ99_02590 [Xylanibacillus composti]|nr:hypothetical protein [Xylanibacillus composti]MDT9723884.1 hypothetical protein [Xylanibacillus composti]
MFKEWRDHFLFLVNEWGMEGPSIARYAGVETMTYIGDTVAIEIECEMRERRVFVLIVKLEEGQLPEDYYVSNGEVVRLHLPKLLSLCAGGSPRDYVSRHADLESQAQDYAGLLKTYADCVHRSEMWMRNV